MANSSYFACDLITSCTLVLSLSLVIKSISLPVTRPTNLLPILPLEVTGNPLNPCIFLASKQSRTVEATDIMMGSVMKPCSYFYKDKQATRCSDWLNTLTNTLHTRY